MTGRLTETLIESIDSMDTTDRDEALVHLAITYARTIDALPESVVKVGPQLLACLEALMMTPRSRAAVMKGANDDQRQQLSPLDELRERRRNR